MKSDLAKYWPLDPSATFLNHGSFGSCPTAMLEFQAGWIRRLERQPVQFLVRELEGLWDNARAAVAQFVGAPAHDLVFVANATTGVNTVVRSLQFEAGDEVLVTDHEYNACRNALDYAARRAGAKVVVANIPFPLRSTNQIMESILSRVTDRTRLALIDHITSPTALVMPIERIVRELAARGVDTLVDGAHAPGMVPLNLQELGAAYYTGNCHKWLCTPKTSALLYVRPDRQNSIHPLAISHGLNSRRTDRSLFLLEFGWMGTADPTPFLTVPETLRYLATLVPGGWAEIMQRNHALALQGQEILCRCLSIEPPCPPECIGSMAAFPIRDNRPNEIAQPPAYVDPLQENLWQNHRIEVPVNPWPAFPQRLLRISAQLYNHESEYRELADALRLILNSN